MRRAALCIALLCLLCAACGGAGRTSFDRTSPAAEAATSPGRAGNRHFAQTATEEGGLSCGPDVAIYRYRPGKRTAKVASLPPGIDYQYSYAQPVRGGVRVLFDRYDCKRKRFEIASVLDPARGAR